MENYINDMIRQGYIDKDGTPLKCNKCGMTVGHWEYGHWDV